MPMNVPIAKARPSKVNWIELTSYVPQNVHLKEIHAVRILNVTETAINFYGDSINMLVDPEVNTIYGASTA